MNTIYREPNSLDFGSPPTVTSGSNEYRGLIEIFSQKRKGKWLLFIGSNTVWYYREFVREEDLDHWFDTLAFAWEDVTIDTLEACGFMRAE